MISDMNQQAIIAERELLKQRTREIEAVREIFRAVNAVSDLRSILDTVTRTATRALDSDSCSIYLLDASGAHLVLRATTGLYPEAVGTAHLELGQGLTGWSAMHLQAVAVSDAWSDTRFHQVPNTREKPFRSLLAVPLRSGERAIGALNVQTHRLRHWTNGDIEFATLIGDMVAGVLERAMLFEQTERRMQELAAVSEVSKAVVAPAYLDETLRLVAEMVLRAISARRCALLLLDETDNAYLPRAASDRTPGIPPEPEWQLDNLPLLNIEALAGPVAIGDVATELSPKLAAWAAKAGLTSLLVVPLVSRERTVGLMNVWNDAPRDFGDQEIDLCTTLANQVALAIENAHLVGNATIVREMNHRVKNNLQNIVMLLQLQLSEHPEVSASEVLQQSIGRIMSIAAVHDALSQEGLRLVDVKDTIQRVVSLTNANMSRPDQELAIAVTGEPIRLSSRAATAVALCVNELVQNAMEHAFIGRSEGTIQISLSERAGKLTVDVRDNGLGFSAEARDKSLGLRIVETLVHDDLRGTFQMRRVGEYTIATIEAPLSFA